MVELFTNILATERGYKSKIEKKRKNTVRLVVYSIMIERGRRKRKILWRSVGQEKWAVKRIWPMIDWREKDDYVLPDDIDPANQTRYGGK